MYQGHHGDLGAQLADVCLPGAAYTEKSTIWVNTEGRVQLGRAAVPPPGASREDWKIVRAIAEVVGKPLPYDDVLSLRDRMWDISPGLVKYDVAERTSVDIAALGLKTAASQNAKAAISGTPFVKAIGNFYQTDPISRAYVHNFRETSYFDSEFCLQVGYDGQVHTLIHKGIRLWFIGCSKKPSGICLTIVFTIFNVHLLANQTKSIPSFLLSL